ncbi:hypothetical protein FOC4_g10008922 [Fusarium odoratissimum]|uniref:Modin n=1 Tax=Fusarium oxysporum f. sp. cubense (strain race 4) TaxID=2502994 RepID=N1S7B8_FUSC4|nr:hypothetical protein FOC4_g10008922 [Fusarium odoratissimum]
MSSNGATNAPAGVSNTELIIACVALVVSGFALVIALLQALQQYYASATGYASCKELVMGKWSKFTHRRLRLFEFRFEVEFQTPVIFVSAPSNKRGPLVSRHEITYMVGTWESYQKTYTWSQDMYDERIRSLKAGETRQAIRTADNELATWLALLMALQRMEKESRQWQAEEFFGYNVSNNEWCNRASHTPLLDNFDRNDANNLHTLTVGMQKKKKSWDTMPEHMKKPYATSTICHIVEIIAMLGIHWRVFNRNENRYRAQGNGFLVTGANVDDLGIVFSSHKMGETWFKENRIIPNENVKELCFGYCPTIFRLRNFKMYADEPKDLGTLQLASLAAMAETLKTIGCNTRTVKYFSKPSVNTRYSHLFPVAFEMLGMVGIVLQIKNTAFRMLPNPTIHHWDRKFFSVRTLLVTYKSVLEEAANYQMQEAPVETQSHAMFNNNDQISMIISEAVPRERRLVQFVLRIHLQEVLGMFNSQNTDQESAEGCSETEVEKEELLRSSDQPPKVHRINKQQMAHKYRKVMFHKLQRLDPASYGERHAVLIDMYISWVRENVIWKICSELDRQRKRQNHQNEPQRIQRTGTLFGARLAGDGDELDDDGVDTEGCWESKAKQEISDVWCVLIFRMICWLLLHDFHKLDVQIDKDGLFGSRLPVYIA